MPIDLSVISFISFTYNNSVKIYIIYIYFLQKSKMLYNINLNFELRKNCVGIIINYVYIIILNNFYALFEKSLTFSLILKKNTR